MQQWVTILSSDCQWVWLDNNKFIFSNWAWKIVTQYQDQSKLACIHVSRSQWLVFPKKGRRHPRIRVNKYLTLWYVEGSPHKNSAVSFNICCKFCIILKDFSEQKSWNSSFLVISWPCCIPWGQRAGLIYWFVNLWLCLTLREVVKYIQHWTLSEKQWAAVIWLSSKILSFFSLLGQDQFWS